ncbi:MAG: transcriptional regulator [Isosphaeraceae bacterium]|jgi:predicted transcriptional regulator|nr:MAG: transcriptional regulator [Isosphaeraceae bacterium]
MGRPGLSDSELEVMKVLWREGAGTVRQVNERLAELGRRWAYTTVLTLLQRLQAKGWVRSETGGPAHVFRAVASREDWLKDRLGTLAEQTCGGERMPLLLALVKGERFTEQQIAEFRRLLDAMEDGEPRQGSE